MREGGGDSDFAKSLSNLNDSPKFENFDRRFLQAQDLKSLQIFCVRKIYLRSLDLAT